MILSLSLVAISYLMGSICSAVIVCRTFNLPDPREEGSKNPGATNVLRIAGKQYAALVLLVDMLKGTIPVLLAKAMGASPTVLSFTVLAAVIGHMYPIFFGFKGGKGVATAMGALLGFHFIIGIMTVATWLLIVNFFKYSSLASIVAMTLAPFYSLSVTQQVDGLIPLFFMVLLIWFKHKDNITRLIDGSESKVILKHSVIEEIMETPHHPKPHTHKEPEASLSKPKKVKAAEPTKKVIAKSTKKAISESTKEKKKPAAKKPTKPKKNTEDN